MKTNQITQALDDLIEDVQTAVISKDEFILRAADIREMVKTISSAENIGRKGGSVKSDNKKAAALLRQEKLRANRLKP
jgi:uncharacterized protein YoxC